MIKIALKRICRCGRLIDYSQKYCNRCSNKAGQEKVERNRIYDKYQRDKKATDFYNSKEWQRVREVVSNKYNGLCVYSLLVDNRIVPADVVHHIISIKDDMLLSLDTNNLIPLSNGIHNMIESEYDKSNSSKELMQQELLELLESYERKYSGGE